MATPQQNVRQGGDRSPSSPQAEQRSDVTLAAVVQGGRLGVAAYDGDTGRISLCEVADAEPYAMLQLLLFQESPSVVLLPARSSDVLFAAARGEGGVTIEALPQTEFASSAQLLARAQLPGTERGLLASDVGGLQCQRALCGLLSWVEKNAGMQLRKSDGDSIALQSLSFINPEGLLTVDEHTLRALDVFRDDNHPSVQNIGRKKEGLSLFGLTAQYLRSKPGKQLLKLWFLRPLSDVEAINERLKTVDFLLTSSTSNGLLKQLQEATRNVHDSARIMNRLRNQSASAQDWANLLKTCTAASELRTLLHRRVQPRSCAVFDNILESIVPEDLDAIIGVISDTVNVEESKDSGRFVIKAGFDEDLDELRRHFEGMGDFLSEVAEKEAAKLLKVEAQLPKMTELRIRIDYYHQLGYLLSIEGDRIPALEGGVSDFRFQFYSNQEYRCFYKNDTMDSLDKNFGDILGAILDLESELMNECFATVMEQEQMLTSLSSLTAELDCLCALATLASEYNYCCPRMQDSGATEIKNGRHPLQELCVENTFVPNDAKLSGEHGQLHVVTGPNFSGKSVYLKQIGLITYMAHIGSFVPADTATVTLADRIFSAMSTLEATETLTSTFAQDARLVSAIVRHATGKSLCLIDEFGAGTASTDGIGLLTGVVAELARRRENCPVALFTTHLTKTIDYLKLQPDVACAIRYECMCVDATATSSAPRDQAKRRASDKLTPLPGPESVVFLYKLKAGVSASSYGRMCASLAGVPEPILQRAAQVAEDLAQGRNVSPVLTAEQSDKRARYRSLAQAFLDVDLEADGFSGDGFLSQLEDF